MGILIIPSPVCTSAESSPCFRHATAFERWHCHDRWHLLFYSLPPPSPHPSCRSGIVCECAGGGYLEGKDACTNSICTYHPSVPIPRCPRSKKNIKHLRAHRINKPGCMDRACVAHPIYLPHNTTWSALRSSGQIALQPSDAHPHMCMPTSHPYLDHQWEKSLRNIVTRPTE